MDEQPLPTDVETLRIQARRNLELGAVTDNYQGDRKTVIRLLNNALATELVCILRYRRHHFTATGLDARQAASEFLEHADQEQQHADMLAARIVQLGGEPDFAPDSLLMRSHAAYDGSRELQDMIREDLIAERIAIDSYREMIAYLGNDDPTTRRMLEDILAQEEEHADDLATLINGMQS